MADRKSCKIFTVQWHGYGEHYVPYFGMAAWSAEKIKYAGVAQSVEQRIRNAQVGGSSPFTSSKNMNRLKFQF